MIRRRFAVLLTAGLALTLAGCGSLTVDKDELEKQINTELTKSVGRSPDSVTCPKDLDGKVDATTRCELKADGETYGVTVKVTKVDGDNVKFDIQVDDAPKG